MCWFAGYEASVRRDEPLSRHTWYRLGGPARWFCTPPDAETLATLLTRCRERGLPWRVLGQGVNVLVRDAGFDGVVFRLDADAFGRVEFRPPVVWAGAGADFPKLIRRCIDRGLIGLEALAGIPGSVGGIVRMNAGGRWGEIGPLVRSVTVVEPDGTLRTLEREALEFGYRRSNLAGRIVVEVGLELAAGDPAAALERHRRIWEEKYATQPPVSHRTAGCIFRNPPGDSAGRLLDGCGLKGLSCGGARISERHANFIEAADGATADDILRLIDRAREHVRRETGVELELEIEIW